VEYAILPPVMATPRELTSREIIERLSSERPPKGQRALLAFDADGTLWRGDVGCDAFAGAIARAAFRDEARAPLTHHATALGLDATGPLEGIAQRLLDAFFAGTWDDGPAAECMALAFAGFTDDEALAFSEEVLETASLRQRTHPGVAEIITWARSNEVEVVVVSASPKPVVEAAVRALSAPPDRVIAMTLESDARGRLASELNGPSVYGEGKVTALDAQCGTTTVLGAFGDSFGDRFLLRTARLPVGVGASAKLLAEAHTIERLVLLPFPDD
jgi:phosphatidylglycerophosphatase C